MVWYSASAMQTIAELKSNGENGLADVQARKLLDNYGENRLESGKKDSVIKRFFAQFADFSVMILLVACVISFLTGFIEGKGDFVEPIVILAIVILNAAIGVFQEQRAEHAIEALRKMSSPSAIPAGCCGKSPKRTAKPGGLNYKYSKTLGLDDPSVFTVIRNCEYPPPVSPPD